MAATRVTVQSTETQAALAASNATRLHTAPLLRQPLECAESRDAEAPARALQSLSMRQEHNHNEDDDDDDELQSFGARQHAKLDEGLALLSSGFDKSNRCDCNDAAARRPSDLAGSVVGSEREQHEHQHAEEFVAEMRSERSNSCSERSTATIASLMSETDAASLAIETLSAQQHQQQQQLQLGGSCGNVCQATRFESASTSVPTIIAANSASPTNALLPSGAASAAGPPNIVTQTATITNQTSGVSSAFTNSSRFFASKLNTGSLWSLLSTSSASDNVDATSLNKPQADTTVTKHSQASSASMAAPNEQTAQQQTSFVKPKVHRFRFAIKYMGSAVLHKNFTLPMLEWIARDIKRQTMRGAQSVSQRQFTLPARDILLEIHQQQLRGISSKDGHCIFVHPMHCVSKYAQLQHDPTCFSYLIRDSKDAPFFCHVFQAKSSNRVHDIFSAIRNETTSSACTTHASVPSTPVKTSAPSSVKLNNVNSTLGDDQAVSSNKTLGLQKSASTDGSGSRTLQTLFSSSAAAPQRAAIAEAAVASAQAEQQDAYDKFENSYQFEVMFIKRVKMQRRPVPKSFVDDALELLQSYEVPKGGAEPKLAKRTIAASVDERQEYDEAACQSPTPSGSARFQSIEEPRRSSCASGNTPSDNTIADGTRSCQQSPTKLAPDANDLQQRATLPANYSPTKSTQLQRMKQQSLDCLERLSSWTTSNLADVGNIRRVAQDAPTFQNDFSPYSTITSSDLNERIAAMPVVSQSSVSLDYETRKKLARQVRETIMATAATIKRDMCASGGGDEQVINPVCPLKALDALSCRATVSTQVEDATPSPHLNPDHNQCDVATEKPPETVRRLSAGASGIVKSASDVTNDSKSKANIELQQDTSLFATSMANSSTSNANNFDMFRRASARQVVKNRTMLLLIGKEELCTISIDKHQVLFSKSYNFILHCLQGFKNRDHFALICRDSAKINPKAESYTGFVFRCQNEKVVREIMGALRQVIYSSQHNSSACNSLYNPINSASKQASFNKSIELEKQQISEQQRVVVGTSNNDQRSVSLPSKRGLVQKPIELDAANKLSTTNEGDNAQTAVVASVGIHSAPIVANSQAMGPFGNVAATKSAQQQSNSRSRDLIKSMFCDNCPLYWYHRLCCDIESLSAETSKGIILRRIDASLSEKEQGELYSRFAEFDIESVDEHNEIFMCLLRQLCERKHSKHVQSQPHIAALMKHNAASMQKQPSKLATSGSSATPNIADATNARQRHSSSFDRSGSNCSATTGSIRDVSCGQQQQQQQQETRSHQRSGSSSGSLAFVLGQSSALTNQSLADAGLTLGDNLKRAKNSISVSIENMLKRRASFGQEDCDASTVGAEAHSRPVSPTASVAPSSFSSLLMSSLPARAYSLRAASREAHAAVKTQRQQQQQQLQTTGKSDNLSPASNACERLIDVAATGLLKRSQSSSDYFGAAANAFWSAGSSSPATTAADGGSSSWRDSLTRTLKGDELSHNIPLVGLFRRRSSTLGSKVDSDGVDGDAAHKGSADCLANSTNDGPPIVANGATAHLDLAVQRTSAAGSGGSCSPASSSASSVLSSAFWKKSIFDKIREPTSSNVIAPNSIGQVRVAKHTEPMRAAKRSSAELRALWRKAILEQITLLKMEKQNRTLQMQQKQACQTKSVMQAQATATSIGNSQAPNGPACVNAPYSGRSEQFWTNEKRLKLNYRDIGCSRDAADAWTRLLTEVPARKLNFVEVAKLVRLGVPMSRRGEVWRLLMHQYQLRHGTSFQPVDNEFKGDANQSYRSLLTRLSTQQHEIFVDIGRTFPTHPYYSQYLSIGQLSLFNLLKAYSLLDPEVGYCQGLSFVAGTLLLHVDSEDEAFELMRHLLLNFGLRKQYLPSMTALHLQLYQITRLLRDHEYELFSHFDRHDMSPSLYAAPWFLTLFASQFPLGFVSRLLDLLFLMGIEAVFRVSLCLLAYHRADILKCTNLEQTMEFVKHKLTDIDDTSLKGLFDKSMSLDLRNQLIEYEIEYTFYCAEDRARGRQPQFDHTNRAAKTSMKPAETQLSKPEAHKPQNRDDDGAEVKENTNRPARASDDLVDTLQDKQIDNTNVNVDGVEGRLSTFDDAKSNVVADATATVIIQHLLSSNHLKTLRNNYSY